MFVEGMVHMYGFLSMPSAIKKKRMISVWDCFATFMYYPVYFHCGIPLSLHLNSLFYFLCLKGVVPEPLNTALRLVPETSLPHILPAPTKVSSISNTNENKGVSITGSHEVPGKSSTDGTTSAAGKTGSFSLDALAKAKKALQMQKELSEKLKKIPLVNSCV